MIPIWVSTWGPIGGKPRASGDDPAAYGRARMYS